ncbi:sensor histidine kinase [Radiobacillus kanasensis]|uniref:sensor histidine kinase n=1 Tax=Radiobacillus kanasensis TaxID=2844358 RepID=UPI001E656383|nr:sensor histidine kinase [Radiobacillus kanasensis]UFT99303.1 sensor histidine kinase [Radiobacillus kanasensis]
MIYILSVLLLLLLIIIYKFYRLKKTMNQSLQYISKKLNQIISNKSAERLLLFTDEKQLRELLVVTNDLLDFHQGFMADNARMRISMNRMLSNVSHDLKTPLTVISGYIETIQHNQKLTPEDRDALLTNVGVKVTEVAGLINKFFDLARLESGDWQMKWSKVHLNELCRKTILGYYDTLTSKGFDVEIDIPKESILLYADADAITRVLENLLSNAIRYGKDGKVIGLTLHQDSDHVFIDVWDRGKGIKEAEANRIFERLYTLDDSRSSSAEGNGLGLTIAKRLIEQMKGHIEYSSIPFKRTVFTIKFKKSKDTQI